MKQKTMFYCTECGNEFSKWAGKCSACGAWNSIVEQPASAKNAPILRTIGMQNKARPLAELDSSDEIRFSTGMGELDRVLGGGAVKGSMCWLAELPVSENLR